MKCSKCGWFNIPGRRKCLQCGALLEINAAIPVYPPRAKKRSPHSINRAYTLRKERVTTGPLDKIFTWVSIKSSKCIDYLKRMLPLYARIIVITIAGYIPGCVQLYQHRQRTGGLLLFVTLSAILLFLLFFFNPISNIVLRLFIIIALYSSYDAVVHHYRNNKYLLNTLVKIGIGITSISLFFFTRALLIFIVNSFTITATVDLDYFAPTFLHGDQIVSLRTPILNTTYKRGDIIVIRSTRYYSVATFGQIVGMPGETIKITHNQIFVNGIAIDRSFYTLVDISMEDATFVNSPRMYVVVTYTPRTRVEHVMPYNILGKAQYIINPPSRRGVVQ